MRYPVEDGPGMTPAARFTVDILVGFKRSTVILLQEHPHELLHRQVVEHGQEADAAAEAVRTIVKAAAEKAASALLKYRPSSPEGDGQ